MAERSEDDHSTWVILLRTVLPSWTCQYVDLSAPTCSNESRLSDPEGGDFEESSKTNFHAIDRVEL